MSLKDWLIENSLEVFCSCGHDNQKDESDYCEKCGNRRYIRQEW